MTLCGVWLSKEQRKAFRFLEQRDMKFLVDFGHGNCIEKMKEIKRSWRRKK